MKKHPNRPSKKNMPEDLKRVTNSDGKRVWITGGKKYTSLAEVAFALRIHS